MNHRYLPDAARRFYRTAASLAIAGGLLANLGGCKDSTSNPPTPTGLNKINHVVVIYLENHSFDNLYGEFAGAEGLSNATAANTTQIDANGAPYLYLPQSDTVNFPANLPNKPFNIDQYVPAGQKTRDLVHRFYQEQMQIDGGRMDKFAQLSDAKGLSMGYYHTAQFPLATEAQRYTLCDHFFHGAFGGSFLNHIWLIAAAPPVFPNAPSSVVAKLDSSGKLVTDGFVTPDGYAVNTSFTVNAPHPSNVAAANLVPNQTIPTIGDRLTAAGVSWAWYSGGWTAALAGNPDPTFQFHHQPFAYFANYADGTQAKADHLKDESEFITAAKNGTLPAVCWVKPIGIENEHPGYADVVTGEGHVDSLINVIRSGPNWKDCAIIITYDENGGFWDHVAPPVVDKWGPGSRVPTIIISPFAKVGYVDKTTYETTSILAFIEKRWNLPPLGTRDAAAVPMLNAFSF
ncbi:MAG TPA: alkaline phosphatase family protein [Candidatus Kapabacteria bacterium]|nr:alkaline phosphatase family protein [Candidatus Kapabacteria bacterium]